MKKLKVAAKQQNPEMFNLMNNVVRMKEIPEAKEAQKIDSIIRDARNYKDQTKIAETLQESFVKAKIQILSPASKPSFKTTSAIFTSLKIEVSHLKEKAAAFLHKGKTHVGSVKKANLQLSAKAQPQTVSPKWNTPVKHEITKKPAIATHRKKP